MEDLVLSIEQCQHLQEFGLDMSDAKLCWRRQTMTWDGKEPNERYRRWRIEKNQALVVMNFESFETIPTYTLQEILNKLPIEINLNGDDFYLSMFSECKNYQIEYTNFDFCPEIKSGNNFFELAYEMLCWVIVNGYLKVK